MTVIKPATVSRRTLVWGAAAVTTAATVNILSAGAAPTTAATTASAREPQPRSADGPDPASPFDEVYKGRRIEGRPLQDGSAHPHGAAHGTHAAHGTSMAHAAVRTAAADRAQPGSSPTPPVEIKIDGRVLHVMRRADGTYMSLLNHYESFPTALACAQAAVDQLGPTSQLALTSIHG